MTREAAHQEAARLSRESPDWDAFIWAARERSPGDWEVVRSRLPAVAKPSYTRTVGAPPYKLHPRPARASSRAAARMGTGLARPARP